MEQWKKEVLENADEWAKRYNKLGMASKEMDGFLRDLSIQWINECDEWREEFVKRIEKTEKIVFLINSL